MPDAISEPLGLLFRVTFSCISNKTGVLCLLERIHYINIVFL